MTHKLQSILEDYARDLGRAHEVASLRFNLAVKAKLDEWRARFPRHAFKAWEGHGRMSLDVYPPVMGETSLDYLTEARGAVGEIAREARAIIDAFNESEQRVGLGCSEQVSAGWQGWK